MKTDVYKKTMTYKSYSARIDFDAEDEVFVGRIANIKDVIGFHADNVRDLKAAFHQAVDDYLEACAKLGKHPDRSFSGRLMLRVAPETHARAMLAAELSGQSLNEWSEAALRAAAGRI